MTKKESLIISAYTGFMICKQFSDMHEFIEQVMERPVFTHEMGSEHFLKEVQERLKPQLIELIKNIEDNQNYTMVEG